MTARGYPSRTEPGTLWVTGSAEADRRVNSDPLALLIAMLLDQQVQIEWAFEGPHRLARRLAVDDTVPLNARCISELDPDTFAAIVSAKPALHRYPRLMATRIQDLCDHLEAHYAGDVAAIWKDRSSAAEVHQRLQKMPGYGNEKARILVAVLAKRFGVRPQDWQQVASPFGDDLPRSVADMCDSIGRDTVRAWRREQKAKGKSKSD